MANKLKAFQLLGTFFIWLETNGRGVATANRYVSIVDAFIDEQNWPLKSDEQTAARWWKVVNNFGYSASTINLKLAAMKAFYDYLVETFPKQYKVNPYASFRAKKVPKRLPKPQSKDELSKILKASYEDTDPLAAQDRVILFAGFGSGLRRSEIADLTIDNIESENILRIVGKGNKEATTCMISQEFNALRELLLDRYKDEKAEKMLEVLKYLPEELKRTTVFFDLKQRKPHLPLLLTADGTPVMDLRNPGHFIWRRFKRMCHRAGVKGAPHRLRHAFVTEALRNGAPLHNVAVAARHESVDTTRGYWELVGNEIGSVGNALEGGIT